MRHHYLFIPFAAKLKLSHGHVLDNQLAFLQAGYRRRRLALYWLHAPKWSPSLPVIIFYKRYCKNRFFNHAVFLGRNNAIIDHFDKLLNINKLYFSRF